MSEFDLAAHAPPIVRAEHVDPIKVVKQVFAPIPARALVDPRIKNAHLRALAALGVHASALGIVYPRLERIAAVASRSRTWAFMLVRDLERWGYVRRLKSGSKRKRHAARRQIRWTKNAPIPRGEHAELDPTLRVGPWMFNQPIQQEVTDMVVTSTRKVEEPVTQDEVGRRQYEAGVAESNLLAESTRLASYFATKYGERMNASTQAAVSIQTARKWLRRGFTVAELRAHVDRVIAEVPKDERLPARLSDYREPMR